MPHDNDLRNDYRRRRNVDDGSQRLCRYRPRSSKGRAWKMYEVLILFGYRYVHDGAEVRTDEFRLSVSDVERTASTTVYVRVAMVDDERPVALRQGRGQTEVDEGGSVVLMAANIAATDNDTNDADLVFSVVQSPQYGDIEVGVVQCFVLIIR